MKNRFLILLAAVALIFIMALPLAAQKVEAGPQPKADILSESFTGATFPPSGWNVYDIDGGGTNWARTTSYYYSTPASAYHMYSASGTQDGWLVTPPIVLASGTNTLTFWEYTLYPSYYVKHSALICTSNCLPPTAPFSDWTELAEFSGPTAAWRQQTVDLTAYQGQTVYIAFRYEGYDADNWYIDDVKVSYSSPTLTINSAPIIDDVCGALGGPGEHNGISDQGETVTLNVILNNTGDQQATGINAVLSTTTPGVVITQANSTYPDIPPAGNGTNNTSFVYTVDQMATCGTAIEFNLHVTASGGWSWDLPFTKTIGSFSTLFSENFDSVTPPALPTGWTMEYINGNPAGWVTYAGYACSSPNVLNYAYSGTLPADVWAYTPGISLTNGTTYTLNFDERVASGAYPEKMSVYIGASPNHLDQTIEILPETTFTNTTCTTLSRTFTVPVSGTYYIGFHCTSDPNMYRMIVDNVVLQEPVCNPCNTNCLPFTFNPAGPGLPPGEIGVSYSQTITASNGTPPYTYDIVGGALPSGLSLSSTGDITGTPDTADVYTFTIRATDSLGCTGTIQYTIEVCSPITVNPPALPGGYLGVPYSQTITSAGGVSPYSYWITMGTVPPGLTLAPNGLLSGTPTTLGDYSFQVGSQDLWGCLGYSPLYSVKICPVITLSPPSLPDGMVEVAYSQNITASGGTAPYTYAITSGSLPSGFVLDPSGLLSGSTSFPGNYSFTITATDATGCQGSTAYLLAIYPAHCGELNITVPFVGGDSPDWPTYHGTQDTRLYRDGNPSGCAAKACPGSSGTGARTYDAFVFPNEGCGDVCVTAVLSPYCTNYLVAATYLDSYNPADICANFIGDPGLSPAQGDYVEWQFTIPLHHKAIVVITMATSGQTCPDGYTLNLVGVPCNNSPEVLLNSFAIESDVCGIGGHGDSNNIVDPGEEITISTQAINSSTFPATNISATLTTTSPFVTITQGTTTFPDMAGCDIADNNGSNFIFNVSGSTPCGTELPFTIQFSSDQGSWQSNFTMLVTPSAVLTLLEEDFENWPLSGWTIGGAGPCYWDSNVNYGRANYTGASGACADADSDACGEAIETTLISPTFSLAGLTTATLEFNLAWYDYYGTSYGDFNISTDGGNTWETMFELTPDYSGIAGRASLDLTPYAGNNNCMIQFHYMTSDWELIWEIDDVLIWGINGPLCSSMTCCPTITIAPPALPNGTVGESYTQTLSGAGGTAPYTFALTGGSLPNGVSLLATGEITGTPSATGTFDFSVTATDANGCQGSANYSLTIVCPVVTPVITGEHSNTCPSLTVTLSTGAYATYQWNDSNGPISGATGQSYIATYSSDYSVTVTDFYGCTGQSATHSVTINPCNAPPVVPYSVTPATITTENFGVDGTITWDVTNCPSANYHIIYGKGENLATWTVDGGVCNIGTSGTYTWTGIPDPSTYESMFLWFLIVGDDGISTEGSWGTDSEGNQRGGTTPSNACGIFTTRDNSGVCGIP